MDVTELNINAASEQFRLILDNLRVAAALFGQDCQLITANRQFIQWFSPDSSPIGLKCPQIVCRKTSQDECADCPVLKALEDAEVHESAIERTVEGVRQDFRLTAQPVLNDERVAGSVVLTIEDVSERVSAVEEARQHLLTKLQYEKRLNEALSIASKAGQLASIGVLASGITHEINQPLNAITLNAESILFWNRKNRGVLPEMFLETIEDISEAAKRMDEIVRHIRSYWEDDASEKYEPVDLNITVRNALRLTTRQINSHGIKPVLSFVFSDVPILANPIQIEQIVTNLISNAMHSLDQVKSHKKRIIFKTEKLADTAKLTIIDNGLGIPEGIGDELFDPFYSTKGRSEGMGLGLAIVKMFVDRFNGKIRAENNEGEGARFIVTFPLADANPDK